MASLVDRIDAFQRRHTVVGFPLATIYKFFDDQSNYLAAILTYYTFAAIFPLLLISSSVLGFILQGNPGLKDRLLESALSQFPIVGTQLGTQEGLQGNTVAVIVGAVTALYGIIGLGQAAQNAVFIAFAIPRNSRPNPFLSRFRSALWLALAGIAVIAVATVSTIASNADLVTQAQGWVRWAVDLVTVLVTASVLATLMAVATPSHHRFPNMFPGALLTAVLWQVLQKGGSAYVQHVVSKASDVNAVFAVVLGLLALLYVAANMIVIGIQVNAVRLQRLYPRALLTPFTDAVDLTEADKRAYAAYAKMQRHKGFERVSVVFDKEAQELEQAAEREREPGLDAGPHA